MRTYIKRRNTVIKDKLYNYFVRKNGRVWYEYERYVRENMAEHRLHRFRHIKVLIKLNWFYRVKKGNTPFLYWDVPLEPGNQIVVKDKKATSNKSNMSNERAEDKSDRPNNPTISMNFCRHNEVGIDLGGTYEYCNVYRKEGNDEYKFASQVHGASNFVDYDVCAGKKYEYRVKASENGTSFSDYSNTVALSTPGPTKYDLIYGEKRMHHDGAESTYKGRMDAMNLAKMLMRYEVISFDIFDTLVFRPFSKPSDLFMLVGQELGIMDFCNIRIDAEESARKKNQLERGNREVTLSEIYKLIELETGVDAQRGATVELETEMKLCYANPYMLRVYKLLLGQGKKIVALSDMYIGSDELKSLLRKLGYTSFDDVIVSCEHNTSKRTGRLFDVLINRYEEQFAHSGIIHIGDNSKVDISNAKDKGLDTYYYENVNERGKRFRAEGMSYLVGSAYSGIVNAHLHSGLNKFSPYYEVGFVYAGIYILGFCEWIHKVAVEKGITRILFLAREGDIYQRAFRCLFDDVETEYVLWSRVPVVKTSVDFNRHPLLLQLVHHKANALYKSKICTLFDRCGFGELTKYLKDYGVNESEYISPDNELVIKRLLTDHWDELCKCYEEDQAEIRGYLESIIKGHDHVAVVDVGWSGNNVLQIKKLVEDVYQDECRVTCMLAAAREVNETYMASMIQNEEVMTYIFSNTYNKYLHDFHQETNNRLNSFFFETLTQSSSPTFLGMHEGKFVFDIPEVENYEHNTEIHTGILDFVRMYAEKFSQYEYMRNISGNDAYMPFRKYVSDLSWIRTYFSNYVFGRDLFATQEKAVMETVEEVMQKANL